MKEFFKEHWLFIFMMFLVVAAIVLCLIYFGTTRSQPMTERGIVFEKSFTPEFNSTGVGVGASGSGHMVTTVTSHHENEKYIVFFRCEHNVVFNIEDKQLWMTLQRNDSVTIDYYELYDHNKKFVDYEFISAKKIEQPKLLMRDDTLAHYYVEPSGYVTIKSIEHPCHDVTCTK